MIDPRLLELAAREVAGGCPTCFIHPDGVGNQPTEMVLLSVEEYSRIHSWVPDSHSHGTHTHVTPDLLDDPVVLGFDPDWRVAPGRTLRVIFAERPITRGRLIERIGAGRVAAVLDGSTRIDHELAREIADATGTPAQLWLALDTQFRSPVTRRTDG